MMDLQYLANLSELVGGVVVVLSLIYIAVQVRQNTQAQRTENYSRAQDRLAAIQSMLAQDGEISLIVSKGALDTSKLTPQERIRFTWFMYEVFGGFEFMFHASRTDAIPEEVWTRWSSSVAWWLTFPGVQAWWQARPTPFTESFTAFMESLLKDNPTDTEPTQRYQEFVAQGKSQI
ncbi:MAG: hypothetical protein IH856_24755 [Deltaproteobacteria bacterium]|nr:hypothetical protein [Deltaproteobacteria bacterium]